MKLYIPTCTLNFNNIFSSESISPACLYNSRGFGNKRYYKVEANNLDNVVLLYSKYPHYHVESGEIENSQLVLEIDTKDYPSDKFIKVKEKDGVEVYVSNTSVYLNPFHFCAYFDSYQELQSALTKAEQSLENKYSKLYNSTFRVRQEKSWSLTGMFTSKDYFDWKESFLGEAINIPCSNANEDILIDRLKGFVTCYIIGANMSVSKEVSRLKQLARKMRNTLSAIVNSPYRKPTDIQDETLISYINEFNSIYAQIDENSKYNRMLIEKCVVSPSTNLDKETILKVLRDLRLEDDFYRKLNLRPVYDANDLYNCLYSQSMSVSDAYNFETKKLFDAIRRVEIAELASQPKSKFEELFSVNGKSIKILDSSAGSAKFYTSLLNSQISDEYKKFMEDNGTPELLSIAFVGGANLKSFFPDKWEGSEYQSYINGLLMNIQQGQNFDIFSLDNIILQSFAAFCQKGEEIDRLTDYMLQCGFSDYRFALGIYGATRGFAALPKTFTNQLINGEKSYYIDFYVRLYKEIFDIELTDTTLPSGGVSSVSFNDGLSKQVIQNIETIEPKKKKQERIVSAVLQTAALEDAVQSPRAFMYIADNVLGTRTKAYKALKDSGFENDTTKYTDEEFREKIFSIIEPALPSAKAQRTETIEKIRKIIELEAKRQDHEAFMFILDNFVKPTDPAYMRIMKLINNPGSTSQVSVRPQAEEKKVTQKSGYQSLKPLTKTSDLFVDDINATNFIWSRSYLPTDVRNVLCKKVLSFQGDYAPNGFYYKDNPRTNDNTISHFIRKCTFQKENSNYPSWIPATAENKALLDRLKAELFERYGNR